MLDFLGIGAEKAGTTWLFATLEKNKSVIFPAVDKSLDTWNKEIRFWNLYRNRGIDWYKSIFEGEQEGKVKGEITPGYAILNRNIIKEIYQHYPKVKIIFTLRNPIYRAWSVAIMDLNFAKADVFKTPDQWFIEHFNTPHSISNGDYETCIKNWKSSFPSDQILILFYEDLANSPLQYITQICNFLNIDSALYKSLNKTDFEKVIWTGGHPIIRPSLLPFLINLYKDKIRSLSEYLKKDLSSWV